MPTAFKVLLQRHKGEEFHRFSGTYTFDEFMGLLGHLWGCPQRGLVVEYTDEEGDRIRVTSAPEWNECIRLYREVNVSRTAATEGSSNNTRNNATAPQPLKLTIRKKKDKSDEKECRCRGGVCETTTTVPLPPSCSSANATAATVDDYDYDSFEDFAPAEGVAQPSQNTAVPPLPLSRHTEVEEQQQRACDDVSPLQSADGSARNKNKEWQQCVTGTAETPTTNNNEKSHQPSCCSKPRQVRYELPSHAAIMDLLSVLFNCNAPRELMNPCSHINFGSVVALTPSAAPSEVHLDIDRDSLRSQVIFVGNNAIEEGRLLFAEKLLRSALLFFQEDVIMEYNLACALSMQKKGEEALIMLTNAIQHGYRNMSHLMTDPDLVFVRSLTGFATVADAIKNSLHPATKITPRRSTPAQSTVASPTATATATATSVASPAVEAAPAISSTSAFTFITEEEAKPEAQPVVENVVATVATPQPVVSQVVVVAPPVVETPAPTPTTAVTQPTPVVVTQPAVDLPAPIRQLLSIFPLLTPEQATRAYGEAHFNIAVAVDQLLSVAV